MSRAWIISFTVLLLDRFIVAVPVQRALLLVGEIINFADQRAVLVIEAALPRPVLAIGVARQNHSGLQSVTERKRPVIRQAREGIHMG